MAELRTIYKLKKFYNEDTKSTEYTTDEVVRMDTLKVGDVFCISEVPGIYCAERQPEQDHEGNWSVDALLIAEKGDYPNEHWT